MIREQQQTAQGAAAKAIQQGNNRKSVTMAIATDEDGNDVICDTQETMVPAMAASNLARQKMCISKPSMTMPLLGDLDYLVDTHAATEIINGTYEILEGTNTYAAEFIAELQMPDAIRDIGPLDCSITPEENKSAWRKEKERTGCEPSTLNFPVLTGFRLWRRIRRHPFGVLILKGHISLKIACIAPILRVSASHFQGTCVPPISSIPA